MNKKNIIVISILLLPPKIFSQQLSIEKYLNDKIKWAVVYQLINQNDPSSMSTFVMDVNIPQFVKEAFNKLSNSEVIGLLQKKKTCWATNLLLYEKYKELPGFYIKEIRNKEDWVLKGLREFDIKYWTEKLQ